MTEFYETRMGHKFFDVTMPGLVAELARLNGLLEKLVEQRPVQVVVPKEPHRP